MLFGPFPPPPFLSFFLPLPSIIITEETGESPADVQRKKRLSTLGSAVAGPGGASFERTQLPNVGQIGRWTVLGYCLAVAGLNGRQGRQGFVVTRCWAFAGLSGEFRTSTHAHTHTHTSMRAIRCSQGVSAAAARGKRRGTGVQGWLGTQAGRQAQELEEALVRAHRDQPPLLQEEAGGREEAQAAGSPLFFALDGTALEWGLRLLRLKCWQEVYAPSLTRTSHGCHTLFVGRRAR